MELLSNFISVSAFGLAFYHFLKIIKFQREGNFESKDYNFSIFSFLFFQAIGYINLVYTMWQASVYSNFLEFLRHDFIVGGLVLLCLLYLDYDVISEKYAHEKY